MVTAVVLSSGSGNRFQGQQPKQFMKLSGLPVIVHTLKIFQSSPVIDDIVIVCHENFVDYVRCLVHKYSISKVKTVVIGGQTRQESSFAGIRACGDLSEYVLVHDGVRPFLSHEVIEQVVAAVKRHHAVDTVIPSADTLVEVDSAGFISNIPDRARYRRGQTPQAFSRALMLSAHRQALEDGFASATDDCQLVMRLGHPVYCVEGDEQNIKITYPIDLHIADKLFQLNAQFVQGDPSEVSSSFRGKVALVIGGTEGIGARLAALLSSLGCRVYAVGRKSSPAVDVSLPDSIAELMNWLAAREENIDFVVNCAGDLVRRDVASMSLDAWRSLYAVNVEGSFNVAQAVIPWFRRQKGGALLFIGSSSYTRGRAGYAAYSSSKAALVNFAQALAEELAPLNVRVNIASPGRVKTGLRERNFGKEPEESLLTPDYVAEKIACALASEITGSVFDIH